MSIVINPSAYTFSTTDNISIKYSCDDAITYGYLYGLEGVINSTDYADNTLFFPPCTKEGTYTCYIGTYIGSDWTQSNNFTIRIKNEIEPPIDPEPEDIKVSQIILNKTNHTFNLLFDTTTIQASVLPSNATNKIVEWSSSNNSIATVNNGVVTSLKNGNCIISCKSTDGSNIVSTCSIVVDYREVEPPIVEDKITLYESDGKTIIGELSNAIECLVEEERNGLFELYLMYPTGHELYDKLEKDNIIIANANDTLKSQKFRIYLTRKSMRNRVEVYARHISFDLAFDMVESLDITNQSCEYCLNQIFRQSNFSNHFKGYSDIINAQDFKVSLVNCIEAIAGTKGSILDTFGTGAEILRDNTNIHVKNSRGHDNEVIIAYRKNLTGLEVEEDTTDLITRIYPYAKYTDESNKEVFITYENKFVDSKYLTKYPHPYIRSIDFSDKFKDDEVPTSSKLKLCAETYFRQNKCDIPKCNYKIEFIPLSTCVGYEELEDKISLCDKITIQDERYGIDTQAKVIKAVYNVLVERYESMELGEPKTTLGDIIGGEDGEDGKPGPPGESGPIGPEGIPGEPGEDGKIFYTWIRYADDALGNGMSNLPNGKEYIGIAYNKEFPQESSNPKDYTWSKYVGDQGIPGEPGEDGSTLYTWVKYADDALGNGMSDSAIGKEYLGLSYNQSVQQESTNPKDYTWTKIKGDQGIPGQPGADGKPKYTWLKYADTPTSGMSDDPNGKEYLGLAYNKDTQQESSRYEDYTWSKIRGEQGPPGEDGSIGDFPDTLPDTPILEGEVLGFASVELKWTYESEVYYEYELYASKKRNFMPGDVDLIFKGQASAFLHQVLPNETWYYKVCAVNSYQNKTEFSNQLEIQTFKISDAATYFEEAAIGNALIGNLSADKIKSGKISGHYIDARNLSVTDGNGKRTLDIDSYGNVNLEVASFRLAGNTINNIASSEANKVVNAQTQLDIFNKLTNGGQTQGIYLNNGKLYLNASYMQTGTIACDMINSTNLGNPIIKLFGNCAIDATQLNEQGKGDAIRLKWDSLNYIRISSASTEMYSSQAGGIPTFRFTGSTEGCDIYSAPNRSLSFKSDGLYTNNVKLSVEGHKHDGVYKPNSYTPTWNEITSKPNTFDTTWNQVSGKPSSFNPSSHNHSGNTLTPDNVSPRTIGNGNSILMHSSLDGNFKNLGWSSSKFGQVVANNGYFGNMYSTAIDNPISTLEDNSLNDIIDDIIIESPNIVSKSDTSNKLLVNVNKLKENVNADLFVSYDDAGSVVVNESNLLALALKEIKSLKEEVKILKQKVGV